MFIRRAAPPYSYSVLFFPQSFFHQIILSLFFLLGVRPSWKRQRGVAGDLTFNFQVLPP